MKKLLALFLAFSFVLTVSSCKKEEEVKNEVKKEDKYEIATWEEYDQMPFMEFLEKGSAAYYKQVYSEVEITDVSYEKGWDKSTTLNKNDATKGTRPVTYIVEMTVDGKIDGNAFYFMERKGKIVKAVSSNFEIGEEMSEANDKNTTEDMLEDLASALKYEERKGDVSSDADEAQLTCEYFLDAYCDYDYVTAETYMSGTLPESVTTLNDAVETNKASDMEEVTTLLESIGLDFETYKTQFDGIYDNIIDKLGDKTSYKNLNITGINGIYTVTGKLTMPNKSSIPDPLADFDINSFSASMMVKAIKNGYIDYSGNFKEGITEQDLIDFVAKELVTSLNKKVDDAKIITQEKSVTITVSWTDDEWLVTSFEIK